MKSFNPHPYIVKRMRQVWHWSPEYREASNRIAVGSDKRRCDLCKTVFPRKDVHVDHIEPVGKQPKEWSDYAMYGPRMFCPPTNLQGACLHCHKAKTKSERSKTTTAKKGKKK